MPISPTITLNGLAAVLAATNDGLAARITHIALGDTAWSPDNAATTLRNERARIAVSGGTRIQPNQIHITAVENGTVEYWIRELGFILDDGTMLAVWSDPDQALAFKAAGVDVLLAFDLVLSALPDESVTVDGTGGVQLPPATETVIGVSRFATEAEMIAGESDAVSVTPNKVLVVGDARYSQLSHSHSWGQTTGKPETFPATSHTHSWGETTGKPATFPASSHSHSWGQTTGKPSTFPPRSHTHSWGQTTGKPTTFPPSSHSHSWSQTTGKPTTFAPAAHTHTWNQTRGKPATFPPSNHSHPWNQITGKPVSYVPSPHQHHWSTLLGRPGSYNPSAHDHDLLYFRKDNFRVSTGEVAITNRYSRQHHQGHTDWERNFVYIYPPTGYLMSQLRGFTVSISRVFFAGNVNVEDIMWCRYRKEIRKGYIHVIAGNNENRVDTSGVPAYVNYMAIWVK